MRKALAITTNALKNSFRSKQTIFWMIAFPLLFMLLFGYLYSGAFAEEYRMDLAVLNLDHPTGDPSQTGETATSLITGLKESGLFTISTYNYTSEPSADLPPFFNMSKGEIDGIMRIPDSFSQNITLGYQTQLRIIINEEDPNTMQINRGIVQGFLKGFVKQIQEVRIQFALQFMSEYIPAENISTAEEYMKALGEPIVLDLSGATPTDEVTQLKFFVPGIIGFIVLFTGINFSAIPIAYERDKGTLQRILSTPTSAWTVLVGKALAAMAQIFLGIVVVLAVGVTLFGVTDLYWRLELMVPAIVLASLNSIGIGLIFSSIAKDAEAANGIALAFAMPMQFFIGLYFPLEVLPGFIQAIAKVFPLTHGVEAIRQVMLYDAGFGEVAATFIILAVGALIVFTVGVVTYNLATKRLA